MNGNRAIWLIYRTDTNARGFWLVKRTLRWKTFMPENFLELNQYFALTSYCNTIGQSNNAFPILLIRVFFGGKTKSPSFDLFIHWLIKQITNTYLNHFSRSYENRSKWTLEQKSLASNTLTNSKCTNSFLKKKMCQKHLWCFCETSILSKHRN